MITLQDATMLDLLPFTFKTAEKQALSAALQSIMTKVYVSCSRTIIWADIEKADENVLDTMAAELDCPFYSTSLPPEQKRGIIAAAFAYNSRIGTVSSIQKLLEAAFGGGVIYEWYEYGGNPYYFKVKITSNPPLSISQAGCDLFFEKLDNVKNKRSKLDEVKFMRVRTNNIFLGVAVVKTYKKRIIPAGSMPDAERGFN